jgi:replicative DNA helicase
VLGSVLSQPDLIYDMNGTFRPDIFTVANHQHIAKAMLDLSKAGRQIAIPALLGLLPPQKDDDEPFSPDGYCYLLLKEHADPTLAQDVLSDLVGMAGRRKLQDVARQLLDASTADDGRDASEILDALVAEAKSGVVSDAVPSITLRDAVAKTLQIAEERAQGARPLGIPWFMRELHNIMGYMAPGHLIGVLADAKAGKTTLGLQQARYASDFGNVVFFSLEMSFEDVTFRLLAQESRVSEEAIAEGKYTTAEYDAIMTARAKLDRVPIHIVDKPDLTVAQMRTKAMEVKRRNGGLSFVLVDYLDFIRPADRSAPMVERYQQVMRDLVAMAKDLGCPVMLLMQRTRESGKRLNPRPQRGDAFGGGATIQSVHAMLAIWREEVWLNENKPSGDEPRARSKDEKTPYEAWSDRLFKCEGKAELINLARRRGKGGGWVACSFKGEYGLYEPLDRPAQVGLSGDQPWPI